MDNNNNKTMTTTQATQATQAIIKCEFELRIHEALDMLRMSGDDTTRYESILKKVLDTGYDINSNKSELLLGILAMKVPNADILKLLFDNGAKVLSDNSDIYFPSAGHAFVGGRVYPPDIAKLLYEHIMAMSDQDFDAIKACFRSHHSRLDVFNKLASDTDKAALYKRAGILPNEFCSVEVQNLAGLHYPARALSATEQLTNDNQALAAEMKVLKEQLATADSKLTKATAIIAKLTSIQ